MEPSVVEQSTLLTLAGVTPLLRRRGSDRWPGRTPGKWDEFLRWRRTLEVQLNIDAERLLGCHATRSPARKNPHRPDTCQIGSVDFVYRGPASFVRW
jgi:hypothetical protein